MTAYLQEKKEIVIINKIKTQHKTDLYFSIWLKAIKSIIDITVALGEVCSSLN